MFYFELVKDSWVLWEVSSVLVFSSSVSTSQSSGWDIQVFILRNWNQSGVREPLGQVLVEVL